MSAIFFSRSSARFVGSTNDASGSPVPISGTSDSRMSAIISREFSISSSTASRKNRLYVAGS